jgi:serine/threonine-protein kinase RsbW
MNNGRSVNVGANLRPVFVGRGAGSLLEIDAWMPSEISAISPLVERLMRLIKGSHCITGEESAVELALREALNNAVVHGNRLDAHKLVHVRCRCKVGRGISLIVSDQGQGFDANSLPDPLAVENLLAERGRGIHIMKLAMDEVSFEQRGAEVHMCKRLACNPRVGPQSDSCGFLGGIYGGARTNRHLVRLGNHSPFLERIFPCDSAHVQSYRLQSQQGGWSSEREYRR